jgi:hypothetical protein
MNRWINISTAKANVDAGKRSEPCKKTIDVAANTDNSIIAVKLNRSNGLRCFVARNMMRMVMVMKKTTKWSIERINYKHHPPNQYTVKTMWFNFFSPLERVYVSSQPQRSRPNTGARHHILAKRRILVLMPVVLALAFRWRGNGGLLGYLAPDVGGSEWTDDGGAWKQKAKVKSRH